jgi:protein subunit release factor B
MIKQKLFSLTKKDFDVQHFCTGGPGGQKQNKTASGCRIVHSASGAVGEGREQRSKTQNQKSAFRKLVASKKFKTWLQLESASRIQGFSDVQDKIDRLMRLENLRIEVYKNGQWR